MAGLYQSVGCGTLQFDRKCYSASWLHYSYLWLGYTKPLGGAPYSLIDKVISQTGCVTLIYGGLYQSVGWGTLQFDRKCYSASWLHYPYFWPGYTKALGVTPYSLIDMVIAQAGCVTPISGRVIPNHWVWHLTV